MTPFTQYKQWMIEQYGDALYRVPVQLATSCPHGRCAFCSENGSKAQQTQQQESPFDQIEAAIQFSKRRYKAQKLMLYIQAFTADLTNPTQQQTICDCLQKFSFDAISVGTRPDCLPPEALDFLEALSKKRRRSFPPRSAQLLTTVHTNEAGRRLYAEDPLEVWLELGVQTANNETLKKINRGHDWDCSKQAILNLAERGIHVAPHVIIGLPDETAADWIRTAKELAKLPISGIKIHNLHIMKGTEFSKTLPPTMNHWEYAEALIKFLRHIPAGLPIMRISTDTPDDQLIAPRWPLEKGQFLHYVIQQMTMREITQGDLTETGNSKFETGMEPVITADGSVTFFSEDWKEHYHTKNGARLEAQQKFVVPSGLDKKLKTSSLKLLDVCFGLGNNSLAALCAQSRIGILPVCPRTATEPPQTGKMPVSHSLDITALEMDKRVVRAAAKFFKGLETDPVNWQNVLKDLLQQSTVHTPQSTISIRWGDARYLIQQIPDRSMDVVFHDPFSSQHCPELWTVEFFQQLHRVLKPDGVLLTYSSSMPVRGAMREAGFLIGETHPGHQMGNGTIASPSSLPPIFPSALAQGLRRDKTLGKLNKCRSLPYRDPALCATSKAILRHRQEALEFARVDDTAD